MYLSLLRFETPPSVLCSMQDSKP